MSKHFKRKSPRLPTYTYSEEGWYFVTLCVKNRRPIFGRIENEKMILSREGYLAKQEWVNTFHVRKNLRKDSFIIMPDHIHIIIHSVENGDPAEQGDPPDRPYDTVEYEIGRARRMISGSISAIIGQYKSLVTKRIWRMSNDRTPIWQRSFYDHIIRTENDLENLREYIQLNPVNWQLKWDQRNQNCFY
ncbi:MAG: transposase [Patescibacteria group bacterium]